jgi:hypothetical protein
MKRDSQRDAQRGSVAIVVGAMMVALFAMAALTIDVGYWYLARRNLQNVADAAIMAGLPALGSGSSGNAAVTRARANLISNGYPGINPVAATSGSLRTLSVSITDTQQLFFGKLFGVASKSLTVSAQGQSTIATPAILALGTSCPPTLGVAFNGGGITINGDIESNSSVAFNGGTPTAQINGSVEYNFSSCGASGFFNGSASPASLNGGVTQGAGGITSPFPYTTASFTCSSWPATQSLNWPVADGTYCATGNISFSASGITGVNAHITLVSASGQITFSASTLNQISAKENGIIAYSGYNHTADCNTQAINVGSGSVVMNGSFYAPFGCINTSGNQMTFNGSIVGNMVQMGIGNNSTVTGAGGGVATYSLYQ